VCTTGSGMPVTTTTIPNCTTSGDGATDAAKYPCPPTAAQLAAGDTCVVAIGDINGDRAVGAISFTGASTGATSTSVATTSPPTTHPIATPTTAPIATPTTAAPQTAPNGALASTGPGQHLWLIALMGFVALFIGAIALALMDSRWRFVGGLSILGGRSRRSVRPGDDGSDRPSPVSAPSTATGLWLSDAPPLWLRPPQR
jgi:hypothetical protein